MREMRAYSQVYRNRPAALSRKAPVAFNNDWGGIRLLQLCEEMGVEQPFHIAFGAPLCAWAGGRPSAIRWQLSEAQLRSYFEAYARHGVTVALTMSRLDVSNEALADPYCNLIMRVANDYAAQAIIVGDHVLAHVREHYPRVCTIASLDKVMCELRTDFSREAAYYEELFGRFDEVVVRCEAALSDAMLDHLALYADRTEIIVNQACMRDCQYCHLHIASMESANDPSVDPRTHRHQECFYKRNAEDLGFWLEHNLLIPEERICTLAERGFTKMKLAGRNAPLPLLLERFERYVFEPTGVFAGMTKALMNEYRALSSSGSFAPFMLPEER